MLRVASLLCVLFLLGPAPALRIVPKKDSVEVTATLPDALVAKLPLGKLSQDDGETWLSMRLLTDGKEGPPMLGAYERRGKELVFVPRFPLQAEKTYRARLQVPGLPDSMAEYTVPPRRPAPLAEVAAFWPAGDVLPANHLRFYIQFSQPMRGGREIFEQIWLLDGEGRKIVDPWLRDELWDETGTLLILYIHPGRIKWGVLLRFILGPVLEPNGSYSLVVGGDMLDADGRKLGKDYTKKFKTVAEDRTRLDLAKWQVAAPKAGGKETVAVTLPKPLDHLGLERFLKVVDAKGQRVGGKVEVSRDGRSWKFTPSAAWTAQDYKIIVDEQLEDPCGNTPTQPFDVDADAVMPPPQALSLSFRPKS